MSCSLFGYSKKTGKDNLLYKPTTIGYFGWKWLIFGDVDQVNPSTRLLFNPFTLSPPFLCICGFVYLYIRGFVDLWN